MVAERRYWIGCRWVVVLCSRRVNIWNRGNCFIPPLHIKVLDVTSLKGATVLVLGVSCVALATKLRLERE